MEALGLGAWHYGARATVEALGVNCSIALAVAFAVVMCVTGAMIVQEERKRRTSATPRIEGKKEK